jgi:hypothetical protein
MSDRKSIVTADAQDEILHVLKKAFDVVRNSTTWTTQHKSAVLEAMDCEMSKIEILFGYEPGEWPRE